MATIKVDFTSQVLIRNDFFYVQTPNRLDISKAKVIYLLHGYWGDATDWLYLGNIKEMADKYDAILVMPNDFNSFYSNMIYGENYYDYFFEVKKAFESFFNINSNPTNTYICGLSMGGYGALKIGLNNLNLFNGIASFSGAVDIVNIYNNFYDKEVDKRGFALFGKTSPSNTDSDLFYLVNKLVEKQEKIPPIFIYCGSSDSLYNDNERFVSLLNNKKVKNIFISDDGNHTWDRWRYSLEEYLKTIK